MRNFDSYFISIWTKFLDLNEKFKIIGKDTLVENDKIVLETTKLKEDYLAQNVFTLYGGLYPRRKVGLD